MAGASLRATDYDKKLSRLLWKRLSEKIIRQEEPLGHLLPPLLLYEPKSIILRLCTYVIADERFLDTDKLGNEALPF